MGADQTIDWAKEAVSALTWWQDAGVDVLVEDAAVGWLDETPLSHTVRGEEGLSGAKARFEPHVLRDASSPSLSRSSGRTDDAWGVPLPTALPAFLNWRASDAAPEFGWHGAAIAAAGPADAAVMVLVDCPERDDRDLLGGAAGRLFDRMLAAIGLSRDAIHLAAVCWKRPTAGRVPRDVEARLGAIARHHVDLVAPERLILMGNAASRAVLSMDLTEGRERLRALNHRNRTEGHALATFHPRFLLERPEMKAQAWRDLMLIGGNR
ncbi:uracil-DNA glycosylase family protein [Sphingomonas sp.]|uniref:uracil-DNA glycosylase family protein n=1 Tax=Sphingomonas sp. TaxID=28214 RepID=UPI0035C7CA92